MKEPSFDSTPEFQHFREVMRGVLSVPKVRLDELVKKSSSKQLNKKKRKGQSASKTQ